MEFSNYTNIIQIYGSNTGNILRAWDINNRRSVIIKYLNKDSAAALEFEKFKQEFNIASLFNHENVIKILDSNFITKPFYFVQEDINGNALSSIIRKKRVLISDFLEIAYLIASGIHQIHSLNIIHKDINPSNIIFNSNDNKLKIIDFGISTEFSKEDQMIINPEVLEGTLNYISPEQTGRMNRSIDYRSDFYSFGATLYELLTGKPPFQFKDAIELVHAHIAMIPKSPGEMRSDVPNELSNIIMHLLEKNAEDRYQSIDGILYDLDECRKQYSRKRLIKKFKIGSRDYSGKFQISQKLYGRDSEIKKLLDTFEWIGNGHCETVFISGDTGVGKSSLVKELYKPVTAVKGYYLYGKYEQLKKNIPYKGIIEASRGLFQDILSESDDKVEKWRKNFKAEIGEDVEIIYELIPEMEMIAGTVLKVNAITPEEREVRIKQIFLKIFKMLSSSSGVPIILVLDDLQWVDLPSINLLKFLLNSGNLKNFFLVGTFRKKELSRFSPIFQMIDELFSSDAVISEIELGPLNEKDVIGILEDTFNKSGDDIINLSELICKKTGGNPFFINEFLVSLYDEKLIEFHPEIPEWHWDFEKIKSAEYTENVINLMTVNIGKLDSITKKVLMNASCIGTKFDFETLCYITDENENLIINSIKNAINHGYLIPISKSKIISASKTLSTIKPVHVDYRFTHDRILQAAELLLDEQQLKQIHQKIGFYYLKEKNEDEQKEKLFEIVNHMNYNRESIENSFEKYEMAVLNFKAAMKAKNSAAYDIAFNYIKNTFYFLPEQAWTRDYDATFNMCLKGMELSMKCGEYSYMFHISQKLERYCNDDYDYIRYRLIILEAYIAENKLPNAVEESSRLLKKLGITIPDKLQKYKVMSLYCKIKFFKSLRFRNQMDILLNESNIKVELIMKILVIITSAYYYTDTLKFAYITLKQVEASIRKGNTPESSHSFIFYAVLLCSMRNKQIEGRSVGNYALKLAQKPESFLYRPRVNLMYHTFIYHWTENPDLRIQNLLEIYNQAMEISDHECAAMSIYIYGVRKNIAGYPLKQLSDEIQYYGKEILKINQKTAYNFNAIHCQFVLNLCTIKNNSIDLIGDSYDEEHSIPIHKKNKDRTAICFVYLYKFILSYIFENYEKADFYLKLIKTYESAIISTILYSRYKFYECLFYIKKYELSDNYRQKTFFLKNIKNLLSCFKKWDKISKTNFSFFYNILLAEYYGLLKKEEKAIKLFNSAIEAADYAEKNNEQALANELCAKYFYKIGKLNISKVFMSNAVNHYLNWQADAKVESLKRLYPKITSSIKINPDHYILNESPLKMSGTSKAEIIDISSVMKAGMAISEEIKISSLLNKMIRILIENAGAQKGSLLLKRGNGFFLVAEGDITKNSFEVMQNCPFKTLEYNSLLPCTILNYVIRLKLPIVLANAVKSKFYNDQYIERNKPLSILCMPIKNHDEVIAVLYLENNSLESAFNENRLETLNIICAQAAISLQNAYFYEQLTEYSNSLEDKVRERTFELENTNTSLIEIYEQLSDARITAHNDLLLAGNVQKSLLPQKNPDDSEWDISFVYKSMTGVSGDFYDFYEVEKKLRGVGIFDVSGHGVSSGLVTVLSKSLISNYFIEHIDDNLGNIISEIDNKLSNEVGHSGNYLTGIILRFSGNKVSYVNAGHPQLLIKKRQAVKAEKVTMNGDENSWRGSFIGMPFVSSDFGVVEFEMESGDFLLLYTDCLYEAADGNNEIYGLKRILLSMEDAPWSNSEDTLKFIMDRFSNFTNIDDLKDDLTVILLRKK
ncbi:MAG: AAA family ATPase [Spirochaetes bacterium]|nr:AAA family ATPase [Spirochaetota bacterium]